MPCPLLHNGEMGTENIRGAPGIRLRHTLGDECRSASISSSTRHHLLSLSLRRLRGLRMRLLMAARCPHMQATCRQHAARALSQGRVNMLLSCYTMPHTPLFLATLHVVDASRMLCICHAARFCAFSMLHAHWHATRCRSRCAPIFPAFCQSSGYARAHGATHARDFFAGSSRRVEHRRRGGEEHGVSERASRGE